MRYLKREGEALEVLAKRAVSLGGRSSGPARSLFGAYREIGRLDDGFQALTDAAERRPDDGELLLFTAEMKARHGRSGEAAKLLEKAENLVSRQQWLRSAAYIRQIDGELDASLNHWREVESVDPAALDVHESIAFLLKGLEGSDAAKEHLRRVGRKFPSNRNLMVLRLQHLDTESSEAIAVLRDLLRLDPSDTWSWRELCNWYGRLGRFDRALDAAEKAIAAGPNDAASHWFRGQALESLQRYTEARAEYLMSIELDIDQVYAIRSIMGVSRSLEEKREVLAVIRRELNEQNSFGDGLFAYAEEASGLLDREDLLSDLQQYAAANPTSFPALSAVTQQLANIGRFDEALTSARAVTAKFPLVHTSWSDLADIHKMVGDHEAELEALRTAASVNPMWSRGAQLVADALMRAGRFADAREQLTAALARLPFDNYLLGYLADVYWQMGEKGLAIETATRAIVLEPEYKWAWAAIKAWAEKEGNRELPVELARSLTQKKPRDVRAWTTLAEMLDTGVYSAERVQAIEAALQLDPFNTQALAVKALALADTRSFDEALELTRTRTPDGHRPEQLRYVEAQIEMMHGRGDRCLAVLVELTSSSPGYLPAWTQLADLYRLNSATNEKYRKAARELVRLAPREAFAYSYLGEACLNMDLKEEARDAFQQAVILDPTHRYAVDSLFELLSADDDLAAAEKMAESVSLASPATGLPLKVELALRSGDHPAAIAALENLLRLPDLARDQADPPVKRVKAELGRKDNSLLTMLEKMSAEQDALPLVGRYLMEAVWPNETQKKSVARVNALSGRGALWAEAANRYIELFAEKNMNATIKFIDANAQELKRHTVTFGVATLQLCNYDDLPRMNSWMEGWRQRTDVAPWMLWNWSLLLWRHGSPGDAEAINRAALDVPYDETVNVHLSMVGLAELVQGKFAEAAVTHGGINPSALTDWDRYIYDLLNDAVWANDRLAEGDREAAQALVESMVSQILRSDAKMADGITRHLFVPAVYRLLQRIGSKWFSFKTKARFWYHRSL